MTKMLITGKLCVICSGSSENEEVEEGFTSTDPSIIFTEQKKFSQFCSELELCCSSGGANKFVAAQFLSAFGKSSSNLFACSECLSLVCQAVEMKSNVEEEECQVVQMQIQLLVKMKALQQSTELYFKEMSKIQERVRSAEITQWAKKHGSSNSRRGNPEENKCDVLLFREKIIDVVSYLGMFREDLDDKLLENPAPRNRNAGRIQSDLSPVPTNEDYDDMNDGGIFGGDDVDWEMNDPSDCEDLGNFKDLAENKKIIIGHATNSGSSQDIPENLTADADMEDQNHQLSQSSGDEHNQLEKKKQTARKTNRKPRLQKGKSSTKKEKSSKTIKKETRTDEHEQLPENLSELTPLRRRLVIYLHNRNSKLPPTPAVQDETSSQSTTAAASFQDPKDKYRWHYGPSTDKFTLADYPINVEEDEAQKLLIFSCTTCDQFQYRYDYTQVTNRDMSSAMAVAQGNIFNHVVGKAHINAFVCPQCPKADLESYRGFMDHLERHDNQDAGRKYFCDQCGRGGFLNKWRLDRHMVSHMTGKEKEKATLHFYGGPNANKKKKTFKGLKISSKPANPKGTKEKVVKKNPDLQCSVCGRGNFIKPADLKNHEWSHVDKELRPSVICPMCGIKLVKNCYSRHLRKYCKALKETAYGQVVTCNQCSSSFQDKDQLKEHMKQDHPELYLQTPYECDQCEVRFCSILRLQYHQRKFHKKSSTGGDGESN